MKTDPITDEAEVPGERPANFWLALLPVVVLIISLWWIVGKNGGDPRPPLIFATIAAALIGRCLGFRWRSLEDGMVKGIHLALPAILILMVIGMLIGLWVTAGVVPLMIVYGLNLLSPQIFLPACCLICAVVSVATGSSWTTAGTVGVALIGVASGLGIDLGMAAGAIISGAYFGDKMSPLSDTTNLAPAVAGAELFEHIRHMVYSTAPSLLIALVLFAIVGSVAGDGGDSDGASVLAIIDGMGANFSLSPLLLLPPLLVLLMVVLRVPALPAMVAAAVLGGVLAMWLQGVSFMGVLDAALTGYKTESGIAQVDALISGRGGMESMFYTVSLVLCAMVFGGVMERTGMLDAFARVILKLARGAGSLVAATAATCLGMNVLASDQYLAIVIPGRMFRGAYAERGLAPKNLSRVLEDVGTITSPLVAWNTCGATMAAALGVETWDYWRFCFFNLINPLMTVVLGFTGWTIVRTVKGQEKG